MHPSRPFAIPVPIPSRYTARAALLGLLLALPVAGQDMENANLDLPGVWAGEAAWGDYDGDGDQDLILVGETLIDGVARPIAQIRRNQGGLLAEDTAQRDRLRGVYFGDVAWADLDNDSDLDLALAGWDSSGVERLILYLNSEDTVSEGRQLTADISQVDEVGSPILRGVRNASVSWADYDSDGDVDLAVSGMDADGISLTSVYRNVGDGRFERDDIASDALLNVHNGDLSWADYDGDGDLDLGLSGENVTRENFSTATEFYVNDPTGTLELDTRIDLGVDAGTGFAYRFRGGSLAWADYDGDGNIDLAASGRDHGFNAVLALFRNRPAGTLTADPRFTLTTPFNRPDGAVAWIDYDGDGHPDLAATGRTADSKYISAVYRNVGELVSGAPAENALLGLAGGTAVWGDVEGDGRPDLLVTGVDATGARRTILYANRLPEQNRAPDPPASVRPVKVTSSRIDFSWAAGDDTPSSALTYDLRVGHSDGEDAVISGTRAPGPGSAGLGTDFSLRGSLKPRTYVWSVRSVDAGLAASEWTTPDTFEIGRFESSDQRLRNLTESALAVADYDGDGDPDLAMTGTNRSGETQSLVYVNIDGDLTLEADVNLRGLSQGDAKWADIDGDGDLDLLLSGEDAFDVPYTVLYETEQREDRFAVAGDTDLPPGLTRASADFADVDLDGDLDLALSGLGRDGSFTGIWHNDGGGSFVEQGYEMVDAYNGEVSFADVDGDGDPDLGVSGNSTEGAILTVYRNEADAGFVADAVGLEGMDASDVAWGDFDRDGDLDLIATGLADGAAQMRLYANDGGALTLRDDVNLPGVLGGDLAWGDYDNDQDLDLIVAGSDGGLGHVLVVYENTIGQVGPATDFERQNLPELLGVDFSAVALADIDSDGDLDLLSSGRNSTLDPASAVNDNLSINPNLVPSVPTGLSETDSASAVTLSWQASQDDGAPPAQSLTYDLRVGSTPDADDIVTGATDLGFGNNGHSLSRRVLGLASETYFWSVRAVDAGFGRSPWSASRSFVIDTVPPQVAAIVSSQAGSLLGLGNTAAVALELTDAHSGIDGAVAPVVEAVIGDRHFPFTALQFTGTTWSGELTVDEELPEGDVTVTVAGLADLKGNVLSLFELPALFRVDTIVPEVTSHAPAAGETDVTPALDELQVTFSETLTRASAENLANYNLSLDGTALEVTTAAYDSAQGTVTLFLPAGALQPGAQYAVEVGTGLRDLAGNRPTAATTFTFRTAVPQLVASEPVADAAGVGVGAADLSATFDAGVWLPVLLEADAVRVLREGVEVLVTVTPFDPTENRLGFAVGAGLKPGSRYEVVLSGRLAGPLRAVSAGDFRWRFSTAIPALVSVRPDSGQSRVAVSLEETQVSFSVPLDSADVVAGNFSLLEEGVPVSLRAGDPVTRDAGVYGLAPAAGFGVGRLYNVQVNPVVLGPLGTTQPLTYQFTTRVPAISARSPAAGDSVVSVQQDSITAVFDAPIDATALRGTNAVRLLAQGAPVAMDEPAYNPDTRTVTITPSAGLRAGTDYRVEIVSDVAGPRGTADLGWAFTTRTPALTASDPADGSVLDAGEERIRVTFTHPVDDDLLTPQNFRLTRAGAPVELPDDFDLDDAGTTVVFPEVDLVSGSTYQVVVSARLGGPLAQRGDDSFTFDTSVPLVRSTVPVDGEEGVPFGQRTITVALSGPVATTAVDAFQVRARSLADVLAGAGETAFEVVPTANFVVDESLTLVTFTAQLSPFTEYQVIGGAEVLGELAKDGFDFSFSTAGSVDPAAGGTLTSADGQLQLYFPPGALSGGGQVAIRSLPEASGKRTLGAAQQLTAVGPRYAVDAGDAQLRKPVTLALSYDAAIGQPQELAIYRLGDGAPTDQDRIGGTVDTASRTVVSAVTRLDTFGLVIAPGQVAGNLIVAALDCQPRAFSPAGPRGQTDISFDLDRPANVTIRVYNAAGRLERLLFDERRLSRGRNIASWDGRDQDRQLVASGLYVVVVSAGSAQAEKVVAVVRD